VARGRSIARIGLPSGNSLPRSSLAEHAGADRAKKRLRFAGENQLGTT